MRYQAFFEHHDASAFEGSADPDISIPSDIGPLTTVGPLFAGPATRSNFNDSPDFANTTEFHERYFSPEDIDRIRHILLEDPFSHTETAILFVAYFLVAALGFFGNGLVCVAVARNRRMRTTRNVFITNLSVANLMLALVLIPFMLMPKFQREWVYGLLPCKVFNVLPGMNTFCSALTIIACAADRYYAVTSRRVTDALKLYQALLIAVLIWGISFLFCAPYALFCHIHDWTIHPSRPDVVLYQTCTCEPPNEYGVTLIAVSKFLFLFPIPLLVLLIFNAMLAKFLMRNREMSVALKNKNENKRNSPSRATLLMYSMAASYAILWMPFEIWNLLLDSVMKHNEQFLSNTELIYRLDATFNLIAMVSICVNPLLYGYLNANFNREFRDIFASIAARLKGCSLSRNFRDNVIVAALPGIKPGAEPRGSKGDKVTMLGLRSRPRCPSPSSPRTMTISLDTEETFCDSKDLLQPSPPVRQTIVNGFPGPRKGLETVITNGVAKLSTTTEKSLVFEY